jgi:autoinducer 2-degrading protein
MISIFVSIRVKPGFRDRFVKATLGDARGSVDDEPGCYRFDVLEDATDPDLVHLYEVYEDQDAIDAHRKMPHYTKWSSEVAEWRVPDGTSRIESTTAFPAEDGWRAQKAHLLD